MFLKKLLLASTVSILSISYSVNAEEKALFGSNDSNIQSSTSSNEVLKYTDIIALKCATPSTCGTYTSSWHRVYVYEDLIIDIPPRLEMKLYWNKNKPAGIAAGRYKAKTIGDTCPDGSKMKADWILNSNGAPVYAIATDCNGVRNEFDIHHLP
ncbi:hypothetical protein [Aliikangiella sp. IMCC44359]|uniref:hypothetical protein n=1 Tax=Aliikangiella sp. IMCC44359 TaxID=3459125 RepID=UPI00403B2721